VRRIPLTTIARVREALLTDRAVLREDVASERSRAEIRGTDETGAMIVRGRARVAATRCVGTGFAERRARRPDRRGPRCIDLARAGPRLRSQTAGREHRDRERSRPTHQRSTPHHRRSVYADLRVLATRPIPCVSSRVKRSLDSKPRLLAASRPAGFTGRRADRRCRRPRACREGARRARRRRPWRRRPCSRASRARPASRARRGARRPSRRPSRR